MKHTLFVLLSFAVTALCGERPIVGAIRWDAWYGAGGATKAVEASFGQPK